MSKYTTLILDMYGVILKERIGDFIAYTFSHIDPSKHENLEKLLYEERLYSKAGYGEIGSSEFLLRLGFENPENAMKDYIQTCLTLDKAFIEFAKTHYRQYDFVLLSTDVSEWSAYITEHYGLNKYFKHKIVSGDVKCRKPDKRIYEIALTRAGKNAEECIFVDDSITNIQAAQELGIHSIFFNRCGEKYDGLQTGSFAELAEMLRRDE